MEDLEILVTLWPDMPQFKRFAKDKRISAIRMNTSMASADTFEKDIAYGTSIAEVPLYLDIKGRQMRVREVSPRTDRLELTLNHPISVDLPTPVIFKQGADYCKLVEVHGDRLIFDGGPEYMVQEGESICIRDESLVVGGKLLEDYEVERIKIARRYGMDRYMLSFVECAKDMEEFREYTGPDAELVAKIESKRGIRFVREGYDRSIHNFSLLAARGDMYIELDRPTHILDAMKDIIRKDPSAIAGSRMMLTLEHDPVPEVSDISELAWLYDCGYRKLMFCDTICLNEEPLARCLNLVDELKKEYKQYGK